MALRQHSLMLAGHFSLHFSARFSLAVTLEPLTSATTALVFDISSSIIGADLLMACLAIGPGDAPSPGGLDAALVDATLFDLPIGSGLNRVWYNMSEITVVFCIQTQSAHAHTDWQKTVGTYVQYGRSFPALGSAKAGGRIFNIFRRNTIRVESDGIRLDYIITNGIEDIFWSSLVF